MSIIHRITSILLFLVMFCTTSCVKYTEEDFNKSSSASGPRSTVRVLTRADGGESLSYPIHVCGFSEDGTLIAQQQLMSPDEPLQLLLPQAQACHLIAISAGESIYQLPDNISLPALITMQDPVLEADASDFAKRIAQGFVTGTPLQIGSADVFPQSDNATVSIQLHYQVASLSVTLQDLPEACTSVYLSVASPYSALSLQGLGNGSQTARIPLSPSAGKIGEWSTSAVYLFPTQDNTTFTIAYNDAEGEQYSSVSYLAPLRAGTPYQLQGTYSDNAMKITGSITPSSWTDSVVLDFSFNPSSTTTITEENHESTPSDTILQPLSLWNGHLVVGYLDADGNPTSSFNPQPSSLNSHQPMLLLSLADQDKLTSAFNESTPTAAQDFATSYSEGDLTDGWRIPTEAEARYLSKLYREDPDDFDQTLSEAQADPIVLTDDKGNNLRYLCENAEKTYSYKGSTVTKAGATVKNYHLRLVRTITP